MTELDLSDFASRTGGSARLGGYLATPTTDGPWPGVVVVHEIFGLIDVMRRQADRLAEAGYLALVPNLYSAGAARRAAASLPRCAR